MNLHADDKATIFALDGMLVSSPINFVSISLLALSVKLRLKMAQINVLTKSDLVIDKLKNIMEWASQVWHLNIFSTAEKDAEYSLLTKDLARSISKGGFVSHLNEHHDEWHGQPSCRPCSNPKSRGGQLGDYEIVWRAAPCSTANLGPGYDVFGLALDAFEDKVKVSRASSDGEGRISIKNSDQAIPSTPESNSAGLVAKR